jgi:hypothetical protein
LRSWRVGEGNGCVSEAGQAKDTGRVPGQATQA